MQAITVQNAALRSSSARPSAACRAPVRAAASKGSQEPEQPQAPSKVVMQTLGVFAAASLAIAPFTGPAYAVDSEGEIKSAAEKSDEAVSNLPSFSDIGKALQQQFGGGVSAPDPKAAADKASGALGEAASKAQNATPDLSEGLLDRAQKSFDQITQQVDPSSFTNAVKGGADDAKSQASDVAADTKQAASSAASKAQNATPDLSEGLLDRAQKSFDQVSQQADPSSIKNAVKGGADEAQNQASDVASNTKEAASSAASKAQNATPDLSEGLLDRAQKSFDQVSQQADPSSFKDALKSGAQDAQSQASDVASSTKDAADSVSRKADNAVPDLSLVKDADLGDPSKVADAAKRETSETVGAAQDAAKDASQKVQNATPDLSDLGDIFNVLKQDAKEDSAAAKEELASSSGQDVSSTGGPNPDNPASKSIAKDVFQGSNDVPVPNVGPDVATE